MGQTKAERIAYLRRQIQEARAQESRWLERARLATTNHYRGVCRARAVQCRTQARAAQRRLKLMKEK